MYYRGVLKYFTFFYYSKRNSRNIIPTNLENKEVVKPSPSVNYGVMCVVELKFVNLTGTNYYGSELWYIALWTAMSFSTHTHTHTHTYV